MDLIKLDSSKCTNCGMCINECPTFVLKKGENGPEATGPQYCISCGHCVAICPNNAIENFKTPFANQTPKELPTLNEEAARHFLRSRRSVRCFKDIPIPREELIKLVDIAHFAPTGSNLQGISYIIVDNKDVIRKAVETEIEWAESNPLYQEPFARLIKLFREDGIDPILHDAPAIILAISNKDFARGRENSILSLAYLELYAPSIGLGSCWTGLFERCALADNSPLLELFHVPDGKKITGVVMVGYPRYSFRRLVDRNPLNVTFY